MKKMKTTIAIALAACVSTQVFAQVKEDVITVALTGQKQVSVSTTTGNNVGNWSQEPHYYKTGTQKLTDQDIIKFIAYVKHSNGNYYSTKAKLVLVQGELSGFFNITPTLGMALPHNHNTDGNGNPSVVDGFSGVYGLFTTDPGYTDASTDIANSTDSSYVTMANGHHLVVNEQPDKTLYPVGHLQPWGKIFIKDTAGRGTVTSPICENVTYYFAMSVEECYDCFYMNSFVSDAKFTVKNFAQAGPVCCSTLSTLIGTGKDRYYLTLSFDNTANNPYLNALSDIWVTTENGIGQFSTPAGPIPGDGLVPDQLNQGDSLPTYHYPIASRVAANLPYEARFTLNGILTYTWTLKYLNNSDIAPDFVGTAAYPATGYGFIALYCQLLTGTATFTEKVVKTACCLDNDYWYDTFGGWYGVGAEYYEIQGGNKDQTKYSAGLYESPINVGPSLTYHHNFDLTYGWAQDIWGAVWPTPAIIEPQWQSFIGLDQ